MKVEDKRETKNIKVKDIKIGECFEYKGKFHIRTDEKKVVSLATGFIHEADIFTEPVTPINAKVVIE